MLLEPDVGTIKKAAPASKKKKGGKAASPDSSSPNSRSPPPASALQLSAPLPPNEGYCAGCQRAQQSRKWVHRKLHSCSLGPCSAPSCRSNTGERCSELFKGFGFCSKHSSLPPPSSAAAPVPAPRAASSSSTGGGVLSSQNVTTTSSFPKRGKGEQSRKNLSGTITRATTSIFLPPCLIVKDGQIFNTLANSFVSIYRIAPPLESEVLDFRDIPAFVLEKMKRFEQVKWGEEECSDVYRSTGGIAEGKEKTISMFNNSKAEFSAARSHSDHCVSTTGGVSAIKFLLRDQLVTQDTAELLAVLGKCFQSSWRAMVEEGTIMCARGKHCTHADVAISTDQVGSWSVDLKMARAHIVEALVDLRTAGKLPLVSGWKVARLFMDPAFMNLEVIHRDENTPVSATAADISAIKTKVMREGQDWN
ncbi:hypothetical protein TeGR_g5164 [Tetraparma gracilis]|uniref:Uncharacterized protein n=1 Tax=Tetraparma gracilis TaxID=2962635 RepID=A0ABQ6MFR3_9STRA|nr:hypothetical protein TeGR_g5164 [Tetraparma gracilis]